jgi:hypothetical protein
MGGLSTPSTLTLAADSRYFNRTFLDSIEDAIQSILGEQVVKSLFDRLEKYDGLTRDQIPRHLDVFFHALEKVFGQTSGKTIGKFIIKVFYMRLGLEFESRSNRMLPEYVEDARRKLGLEN